MSDPGSAADARRRLRLSRDARFTVLWALAWALIGGAVACASKLAFPELPLLEMLKLNVLFAEVVGFSALTSARVIFPFFRSVPPGVRLLLQVLVLFSGALFGCILVVLTNPLFSLSRPGPLALAVLVNAGISVAVGIALHTYDSMRRQIEQTFHLQREREGIQRQLDLALEVQKELFPKSIPRVTGFQLAGVCLPAIGVGGDYYDFLPLGDEKVGLVVADVSGKGIPAALLMAGLQASVRGLALPAVPCALVNQRLNDVIFRSTTASRYATLFFGVFDGTTRTLCYSNAGHNPPILIGASGALRLRDGGIPLGVLSDVRYDQNECQVEPGDILALYTDGVTESANGGGIEFGEDRLVELLVTHRGRSLEDLIQIVIQTLKDWSGDGPPHDDITLVLARAA
jgi:serine phosphatase RsbU (regulator of sigma subunit)